MKTSADLAPLLEAFFTQRLIGQRKASQHTIVSYRDTFSLLFKYAINRLGKQPSTLMLTDLSAPFLASFLSDLESTRGNCARSRNARLAALRSFFRYAALEAPQHGALIQRVLAIPSKRHARPVIDFLNRIEIEALLSVPDRSTWIGRRDHALLLTAVQTGLRLSEISGLLHRDITCSTGAHVRCQGKGRKERCTPLTKPTAAVLTNWMEEGTTEESAFVFPSSRGGRLSADAIQQLVARHVTAARIHCPSLTKKHVTPHVLRHTAAMELLQAGVDRALIAIWLGHESVESTQIYLDADLELKKEILARTRPVGSAPTRFRPGDSLMCFLKAL
ncbi:MAG: tyrosine-type recombinase/integrase [Opitutus sp.]